MIVNYISVLFYLCCCVLPSLFALPKPSKSKSKCSQELEKVLFKPFICGKDYFQRIEENFMTSFRGPMVEDPAQVSTFCQKFSSENDVTVNILNQEGIDMCQFNNPTASLLVTLFGLLNSVSAEDRSTFFEQFSLTKSTLSPSDGDLAGIILMLTHLDNLPSELDVIDRIQEYISDLRTVGLETFPQPTRFISQIISSCRILSTQPNPNWIYPPFHIIKSILSSPPVSIVIDILLYFLINIYVFPDYSMLKSTLSPLSPLPDPDLQDQIIFLLNLLGTFGVVKNFSNPLTVNVVEEGLTAYNHFFGQHGTLYRIVFSQSKENILE